MKKAAISFFLFLFGVLSTNRYYAQAAESSGIDHWWINLGVGPEFSEESGIFDVGLNMQMNKVLLSFFITGVGKMLGDSNSEYSALYSYVVESGVIFFSGGAGLSLVTRHEPSGLFSNEPGKKSTGVGLTLRTQLFWRPTGFLGFGLSLHANVNGEKSISGLILSLKLGGLRES